MDQKLAIRIIMDCKTTSAHKFRAKLGFKHYNVILTKQSVLTKVISSLKGGNMQTQHNGLDHRTDLYFYGDELAIEIDENGHSGRNIDYEIRTKGHKATK